MSGATDEQSATRDDGERAASSLPTRALAPVLPGLGPDRLPNRAFAGLYLSGALFATISLVVPHGKGFRLGVDVVAMFVTGGAGLGVLRLPPLNRAHVHAMVALAGIILATCVYLGRQSQVGMVTPVLLVWATLAAAQFLPPLDAAVQTALNCGLMAAVLFMAHKPTAAFEGVFVIGTAIVAAVITAYDRAQLRRLAGTDFLTGLPNRNQLYEVLGREMSRSSRLNEPLSLAVLDLDGFKDLNDSYGHQAGDSLLVEASSAWRTSLRPSDMLARLGGDEFVVVLPATPLDDAAVVLDRLRQAMPGCAWSAGPVTWDGQEDLNGLIARADAALYSDKRLRGRVAP